MKASGAPSMFRSRTRHTSLPPFMTWMMAGEPLPLTSTFTASDELASHGSWVSAVSRFSLATGDLALSASDSALAHANACVTLSARPSSAHFDRTGWIIGRARTLGRSLGGASAPAFENGNEKEGPARALAWTGPVRRKRRVLRLRGQAPRPGRGASVTGRRATKQGIPLQPRLVLGRTIPGREHRIQLTSHVPASRVTPCQSRQSGPSLPPAGSPPHGVAPR